jgi:hypothetical protein
VVNRGARHVRAEILARRPSNLLRRWAGPASDWLFFTLTEDD